MKWNIIIYHILSSAHLWLDIVSCVHMLAVVSDADGNMGVQVPAETLLSVVSDMYPEVGLLDPMVVLFLIF